MSELEQVKQNIERGYTVARHGSREYVYDQMYEDIETLLRLIQEKKSKRICIIGNVDYEKALIERLSEQGHDVIFATPQEAIKQPDPKPFLIERAHIEPLPIDYEGKYETTTAIYKPKIKKLKGYNKKK